MTIYKKSLDYFGVDNSLRDELDSNWLNIKKYLLSNDFTERWIINKILNQLILCNKFDDYHLTKLNNNIEVIIEKWSEITNDSEKI